jgi:hypothetical protein
VNSISGTINDQTSNPMTDYSPATNLAANKDIVIDTVAPVLSQTGPVATPATNQTPSYTFTSSESGTITYGGSCSSATTSATTGSNTVIFNTLAVGTYTNCTVTVTDSIGNASTPLAVSSFTITSAPVVVTPPSTSTEGGAVGIAFLGPTTLPQTIPTQQVPVTPQQPQKETLPRFTRTLALGTTNIEVLRLQIFLNTHGFPVSVSGAGSPGKETNFFGRATFNALVKFQKAYGIKPTSGFFGPLTKSYVNAILLKK